ncbi:MAG TPA: hypothetical protein VFG95_00860, partial [Nitrospiria bacterium]|nr:hypothetical protein [Nitrospiria bacterium]
MAPIRTKYLMRVVGLLLAVFLVSRTGCAFAQNVDEILPTINSNEPGSQSDPSESGEGKKLELKENP